MVHGGNADVPVHKSVAKPTSVTTPSLAHKEIYEAIVHRYYAKHLGWGGSLVIVNHIPRKTASYFSMLLNLRQTDVVHC